MVMILSMLVCLHNQSFFWGQILLEFDFLRYVHIMNQMDFTDAVTTTYIFLLSFMECMSNNLYKLACRTYSYANVSFFLASPHFLNKLKYVMYIQKDF